MRHPAAILVLLVACFGALPARSDVAVLKNGARYEGAVLEETPDAVVFQSDGIAWTFRRTNLALVTKDEATRTRELRRAEAPTEGSDTRFVAVRPVPKNRVVVYGTSWCGWCRRAREYFSAKGVHFEDKDVERDRSAASELAELRRRNGIRSGGVPVIAVGGTVIVGFDQQRIDAALARR